MSLQKVEYLTPFSRTFQLIKARALVPIKTFKTKTNGKGTIGVKLSGAPCLSVYDKLDCFINRDIHNRLV